MIVSPSFFGAGAASAQTQEPRFRVEYDAPSACPDRDAFLAFVAKRTDRLRLAAGDEPAVVFSVRAAVAASSPHADAAHGQLTVREPDGTVQERSVSAATCREVVEGLALVAALIVDPDAELREDQATLPEQVSKGHRHAPRAALKRTQDDRALSVATRFGVELGLLGGIAPSVAPMGGIFAEVSMHFPGTSRAFIQEARASLNFAGRSDDPVVGKAQYWWAGGSLRLCPVHFELLRPLRLGPCAGMELGVHHGSTTEGVPNPASRMSPWLAPTATAVVVWTVSSAVSLELQGGAVFPLVRTRFFLAPDTTIFATPAVSGMGSLAVSVRFQ